MTRVVAGILRRGQRILICQRGPGRFAGQWEFPGGKCEPGESEAAALARELSEELGIAASVGRLLARVRHRYAAGGEVEVAFYEVPEFHGEPREMAAPPLFAALVWAPAGELGGYDFLAADVAVVEQLRAAAGGRVLD